MALRSIGTSVIIYLSTRVTFKKSSVFTPEQDYELVYGSTQKTDAFSYRNSTNSRL
jgi:hypothetical protein